MRELKEHEMHYVFGGTSAPAATQGAGAQGGSQTASFVGNSLAGGMPPSIGGPTMGNVLIDINQL